MIELTATVEEQELIDLFNSNDLEESIEALKAHYFYLLEDLREEEMADGFIVLDKCVRSFSLEKSTDGLEGFRPYFFQRYKWYKLDQQRACLSEQNATSISAYKRSKETQEAAEDEFKQSGTFSSSVNTSASKVVSLDASLGHDLGSLAELIGSKDSGSENLDGVWDLLNDAQKDLFNRFFHDRQTYKDLALALYGVSSSQARDKIKAYIANIVITICDALMIDEHYAGSAKQIKDCILGDGINVFGSALVQLCQEAPRIEWNLCDKCQKLFYPVNNKQNYCSLECAERCRRNRFGLTREFFAEALKVQAFNEIAADKYLYLYQVTEWADYFGFRHRAAATENGKKPCFSANLPGYPSRQEFLKMLNSMPLKHIESKLNLKSRAHLDRLISWYQLEKEFENRKKVLSKEGREVVSEANRRRDTQPHVRKKRIKRGWQPEVPDDPTKAEMLEVFDRLNWRQMEDHFQISAPKLRQLAKDYNIFHKKRKYIFPEGHIEERTKAHKESLRRDRHVPTGKEIHEALGRMDWNELTDLWGWSDSTLREWAKKDGITDEQIEQRKHDRRNYKNPLPNKDELTEAIKTFSVEQMCERFERNEEELRYDVWQSGLNDLMLKKHKPTPERLRRKLKFRSVEGTMQYYHLSQRQFRKLVKEYDIDLVEMKKKRNKLKKRSKKTSSPPLYKQFSADEIIEFFGQGYRTNQEICEFFGVKSHGTYKRVLRNLNLSYLLEKNRTASMKASAYYKKSIKLQNEYSIEEIQRHLDSMTKKDLRAKYGFNTLVELKQFIESLGLEYENKTPDEPKAKKKKLSLQERHGLPPAEEIEKLLSEGKTRKEIQEYCGCGETVLSKYMREQNLVGKRKNKKDSLPDIEGLKALVEAGYSANAIGRKHGVDSSCVKYELRKHGVEYKAPWKDLPTKEEVEKALDEGLAVSRIARNHGISHARLKRAIHEWGLEKRAFPPDPSKDEILEMRNKGMSWKDIGKELGFGVDRMRSLRKKLDLYS